MFEGLGDGIGMQVLNNSLTDEDQRVDDADGEQDIEGRAGGVDPEVPRTRAMATAIPTAALRKL
jgi:hypothetical protein